MTSSTPTSPVTVANRSTPVSPVLGPPPKSRRQRKVRQRRTLSAITPDSNTGKSRKNVTYSELHHPLLVDFQDPSAIERTQGKHRPNKLYRYHCEDAATLSEYVNAVNHTRHKEVPDLKLDDGNAFQSVGTLKPNKDITKERIHRHYKTQMKRHPSPFISAMVSRDDAEAKMKKMYEDRITAPGRMFLAEIGVPGLVAGILKTRMSTTPAGHSADDSQLLKASTTDRDVEIPIWVLDATPYQGSQATRPSSSIDEILKSGGLIWLSINELTKSDLQVWASRSHENEWLTLSKIPSTFITNIMPFNGAYAVTQKGYDKVRNRQKETYIWNWDISMWEHDPDLTDLRPYCLLRDGNLDAGSDSDD